MPRSIDVVITYLEQTARPLLRNAHAPRGKFAILRAEAPPVHFYRYLYGLVGGPYHWVSRKRMSDLELAEIIEHGDVHIHVLYIAGSPAGMVEIDYREPPIAELRFFGLAEQFHGRGLGRFFLAHAIDLAWSLSPVCLRLETCTLDHPAALPLYQKMGFNVVDQRQGQVLLEDGPAK